MSKADELVQWVVLHNCPVRFDVQMAGRLHADAVVAERSPSLLRI